MSSTRNDACEKKKPVLSASFWRKRVRKLRSRLARLLAPDDDDDGVKPLISHDQAADDIVGRRTESSGNTHDQDRGAEDTSKLSAQICSEVAQANTHICAQTIQSREKSADWVEMLAKSLQDSLPEAPATSGSAQAVKVALFDTPIPEDVPLPHKVTVHNCLPDPHDENDTNGEVGDLRYRHAMHSLGNLTNLTRCAEVEIHLFVMARSEQDLDRTAIVKAMKECIEMKMEVICVPFGIREHDHRLQSCIKMALKENICILAASSNDGHNYRKLPWPASEDGVLSIFATDSYGNPLPSTAALGDPSRTFGMLGLDVPSWGRHGLNDNPCYLSGASMATVLMTATVAVLLAGRQRRADQGCAQRRLRFEEVKKLLSERAMCSHYLAAHLRQNER
ncbi:hypothetical protein NLG97_g8052 [Lecanicillium saksenae]|uniref:Uncharacterized protein n=1 Tax=Lecanicillium saksenae TaxID=468837 RepID=A0ACC1QLD6_9HYPO|nr:hypothetical protein NLG97_g8052 [Lecanicillium saksenae]